MADLVRILEREIAIRDRKSYSFPHSLWVACVESTGEKDEDQPLIGGWPKTHEVYREALRAIAEASGINTIGYQYVDRALEWARGRANRVMLNSKYASYEGPGTDPELDERDRRQTTEAIRRAIEEAFRETFAGTGMPKIIQQVYSPSTKQTLTVFELADGTEYPPVLEQIKWTNEHRDAVNLILVPENPLTDKGDQS